MVFRMQNPKTRYKFAKPLRKFREKKEAIFLEPLGKKAFNPYNALLEGSVLGFLEQMTNPTFKGENFVIFFHL